MSYSLRRLSVHVRNMKICLFFFKIAVFAREEIKTVYCAESELVSPHRFLPYHHFNCFLSNIRGTKGAKVAATNTPLSEV